MQLYVIGIGSRMVADDEIGLVLVDRLRKRLKRRGLVLEQWADADAMSLTHDLLPLVGDVVFVDAADMKEAPGTWRFFDASSCKLAIHSDSVSTHGLGLADAIEMARNLGFNHRVWIFGVQPFDLSPGSGFSPEMTEKLPAILEGLCQSVEKAWLGRLDPLDLPNDGKIRG